MVSRYSPTLSSDQKRPPHLRFVESVRVRKVPQQIRIRWRPFVLIVFWTLIAIKCLLAHWAIHHWEMPIGSIYIWAPSVAAAALCTLVFLASGKVGGQENSHTDGVLQE